MTDSTPPAPPQLTNDDAHLRTLSICHYVAAGLAALCGVAQGLLSIWMSSFMKTMFESIPTQPGQKPPPPEFVNMMTSIHTVFGGVYLVMGCLMAILLLLAGRFLAARRNRMFVMIVAGLQCLWIPFGTVLGVFTLIVLCRPTVTAAFARE